VGVRTGGMPDREGPGHVFDAHDSPGPRWGVMGGTFDPVHYAHLAVAEQSRDTLGLRGVLFVPARQPPHKPGRPITPAADRVAMLGLAIADNPAFHMSLVEVERDGPSYTVDTIEQLRSEPPETGAELLLIISVEALGGFPTWREPSRLLDLCRVVVVPRRGYERQTPGWISSRFPGREDRFVFVGGPDLGHSASEIRSRVLDGRTIRYLVPPAVEAYIRDHALYSGEQWQAHRAAAPGRLPAAGPFQPPVGLEPERPLTRPGGRLERD
jgi:nicotinate-nucleotide adenylyltransferase